jgi:methyl-accepting chemotaxis protein
MRDKISQDLGSKKFTVRTKINLMVSAIFFVMATALMLYEYKSDLAHNLEVGIENIQGMNTFYFDALNTLMLTGTMSEREILREKMLRRPGMLEVRVNRGHPVKDQFGEGFPTEQAVDELDERALKGESIVEVKEINGERAVTVIEPYHATENTRGVNCLMCHQVPSGAVNGAIRITYSLGHADDLALSALWKKMGVIFTLMVLGLVALSMLMNKVVAKPVRSMMERLKDISAGEGDLTQQLDESSSDELGELAHWFNKFVGNLRETVQNINGYAADLSTASEEMHTVAEQTSSSVKKQQSETDQVATAMTEMSATVEEVSNNASAAAGAATKADQAAKQGKQVVNETIHAINALAKEVEKAGSVIQKLEEDSNGIGVVLDVIRGIAEQTNLLALNAAIEAARAGEQGRGFAVVADEVRTLAERTQQSTQEIRQIIERLQTGAKDAVDVMVQGKNRATASVDQAAKAGTALDTITEVITAITDMNTQIASAAEEHSTVAAEINRNVVNISEAGNLTAADTVAVAESSQKLSKLADNLQAQLGRFKV